MMCFVSPSMSYDVKRIKELKKVQVGNNQEMAQSERNSHSINRRVKEKLK